jgi:hypothetical protein
MKSFIRFFFSLAVITLLACNNGNEKKKNDNVTTIYEADSLIAEDFCKTSGSGNFIIDPQLAQDMIKDFDTKYKMTGTPVPKPNLLPNYWVDKCIVFALDKFFIDSTRFDGAWVIFGADEESTKTTVFIVPTIPNALPRFHDNVWDVIIPGTNCTSSNYFLTRQFAEPKILKFRAFYREDGTATPKDSLSKKVWVNECVFKSLAAIIKNSATTPDPLDGISIESAAYPSKTPTVSSQVYDNQSTIVIVTTRKGDVEGTHTPAWDITNIYYHYLVVKRSLVYNHGELCPNACGAADL